MLRSEKGITLVALVVTIIVLIILATIAITVVIDSDLIGRAESTEDYQSNAVAYEQEVLMNLVAVIDQYGTATATATE